MKYFVLGAFSSAIFLYGIALVYGGDRHHVADRASRTSSRRCTLIDERHADRGPDAPARRARLQGRRGPVPHVDARRLRGRPDPGHRVHGLGHQGGRVRRAAPGADHGVRLVPDRLAAGDLGARDPHPARSAASSPSSRPTSSGCSPTRRSATPATCSSASRPGPTQGLQAALFYLLVYTFMTIGSFAIVVVIGRRDDRHSIISDYRALATRQPLLAALLAFFLLAQAGIPPTGGFIAKLGVFASVADDAEVRRPAVAVVLAADRRRGRLGDRGLLLPAGRRHDVLVGGRRRPRARTRPGASGAADPRRRARPEWCSRSASPRYALGRDPALGDARLRPGRDPHLLSGAAPTSGNSTAFPVCRFAKARTYTRPDQPHSWWRGLA